MSKAEDRYLEHFQDGRLRNCSNKDAFLLGYHQAEKDLALTWEDMVLFRTLFDVTDAHIRSGSIKIQPMTKEYYQEVLNQFNKQKGK